MELQAGTSILHYRLVEAIGEGGMGAVWCATDTKLDREVAIKVLLEDVATDPERIARFEREARVLASLSHQNIATLHGIEEHEGHRFLVMELAEGETLAEWLARGPVPADEALEIAIQIAKGLEAAHGAGIVHRDLKPANVMLSREGRVKLLDFGLGKPWQTGHGDPDFTNSETLTAHLTGGTVLLGTAAYMSPEQARGKEVDNRTDNWAFGCVLYEMLTGTKAFTGETVTDVLASVVTSEPDWELLPEATPAAVRQLIRRCLQKAPKRRLHSIADARIEIEDALAEPVPAGQPVATDKNGRRRGIGAAAAVVLALAAAIVGGGLSAILLRSPAGPSEAPPARGPKPVVILMDTPAPIGVYHEETRKNAGTNADDLNDLLRDLPIEIHKESVGSRWDREDQILMQRPDLIVIHRSAFFHPLNIELGYGYAPFENPTDEARAHRIYDVVLEKLMAFFAYVGLGDPHTEFLVYSRGGPTPWVVELQQDFVADVVGRYPHLEGRVFTFGVPPKGDAYSSFRDPTTAAMIRAQIVEILGLDDEQFE